MPYLPPTPASQTQRPKSWGKDVQLAVRTVEEKYRAAFPAVDYYPILATLAPHDGNLSSAVGEDGQTKVDPLYNEAVDADGDVVQPHLSSAQAANPEVYAGPFRVFGAVRREATEKELKRWGFEKVRDIVFTVPLSILDGHGIEAGEGDKFLYDGWYYEVREANSDGYWKGTNVRLFRVMNCRQLSPGS